MPNSPATQDMRVALLYQTTQHGSHLREALKDLGASVVYEAQSSTIDRDALEGSGARVVIVNLDADSDEYIDQVYDVLDAGDYEIVFNDAQVSSNLSGWDHARWARNLASKIIGRPDAATPPRPPGAEAVPTPVQKSASVVPVADKPGPLPGAPAATPPAPAPVRAAVAERPTMEMPLPTEFREPPKAEPKPEPQIQSRPQPAQEKAGQPEELDIAALGDFVREFDAPVAEPAAPAAKAGVVQQGTDADFAAELDALFAAADAPKKGAAQHPIGDELDIGLPADFDLGAGNLPTGDAESIELVSGDDAFAATPGAVEQLHDEFPAIFDQLDVAAAHVPEAVDNTFKSADKKAEPAAEPLLPPDWNLEPVDDDVPANVKSDNPFGIEKMETADFLAPEVEQASAKQQATLPTTSTLSLELMPMEEAVAPVIKNPELEKEHWLDGAKASEKIKGPGPAAGVLRRVIVLGASIGGPEAVRDFLGALPVGFPVLFILAQHMGEEFLELMSAQLRKSIVLTVRNPTHGERVGMGEVLIVPTTHRLQVDTEGVITLAHLPEKPPYSPSIDMILRDVADTFGDKGMTIIFSGMAHDAIEGSQYLKSKGGTVWVQDPDTCVISSMVDGAREAGIVSFVGSPAQLAQKVIAEYGKA